MVANLTASLQSNAVKIPVVVSNISESYILAGVVFESVDSLNPSSPGPIQYKLRFSATSRNTFMQSQASAAEYHPMDNEVGWVTGSVYPMQQEAGPRAAEDPYGGAPGIYMRSSSALSHQ